MKKTFAVLMAIIMLAIMLVPAAAFASTSGAGLDNAFIIPTDYNTPSNVHWEFETIDGTTVDWQTYLGKIQILVFYRADGKCSNSNNTISSIAKSEWVKSDKVKVIAVAVENVGGEYPTREQIAEYKNKYAPGCDDIVFAFEPESFTMIKFERLIDANSTSWSWRLAVNYVVDANNNFRYTWQGNYDASYYESILSTLDADFEMTGIYRTAVEGYAEYAEAFKVLELLNEYRKSKGLPELQYNSALMSAAMQRAAEISVYYSHTRPSGVPCQTISLGSGVTVSGENIAAGYGTPESVMTAWQRSKGHNANMLNEAYNSVGIGTFTDISGNRFWVQVFSGDCVVPEASNYSTSQKIYALVEVSQNLVSLEMSPTELKIPEGKIGELTLKNTNIGFYTVSPLHFTYAVSEDAETADVGKDEYGKTIVIAKKEGTTYIDVGLVPVYGGEPLTYRVPVTVLPPYDPGDVNGDGNVTLDDAVTILKYAMNVDLNGDTFIKEVAEVTGDGEITLDDAVEVLKIAMKVNS